MYNPRVYDSDGGFVGSWDRTNGEIELDNGGTMNVDSDGTVTDSDGNYVGTINSRGCID